MAASVWMKLPKGLADPISRPTALMMPMVTVWPTLNGSPIASTTSPTFAVSDEPKVIGMSPCAATRTTARSVSGSEPTILPMTVRPSLRVTWMSDTPSTTWSLVRMYPSRLTITPEPSESCVSLGRLKRSPKKRWNAGSSRSGLRRFTSRVAEMFTTAGMARRAASLKESRADVAGESTGTGSDSRTSTTCERQASQSGFTRLTTKSMASVSVTAWAKRSQSLRIRSLFSHEGVADLAQQHDVLGRRRGRGGFLLPHAVDLLHHEEDDEGEDHEVHQDVHEVAPCDHRDAGFLEVGERVGHVGGNRRQRDVVLGEVQPAGELADHRHDQVAD